jgi:hypothetical protein
MTKEVLDNIQYICKLYILLGTTPRRYQDPLVVHYIKLLLSFAAAISSTAIIFAQLLEKLLGCRNVGIDFWMGRSRRGFLDG